ncbi:ABC transporter ATP-binding protein [Brachybacterium saurashtrense]|uniref:ABC transporter ATP-binding protein n=1 Tax=Brachybacterium saurashtrense TaxID=556288 RepID=A0A345YLA8_9MICO|nr:ABC transporter ATP-binding protein [Brachybacterium saurashtrense]AXK44710.1 ABC transporter ATP-binding protein [Brachybacterium saurashtrense]RRR23322.1 ABC transporter ATP-binding protein [Brachybacterium saurashtrense]
MSEIDWKRPLEDVLGEDETARRQLAEHAQLLPIADARTAMRFMGARLREHWVATAVTLLVNIGGAVAAAILPRLIGSAVDVVADGGSTDRIWALGGQILAVGAVQALLMALGWWLISALGQRILAGMREQVIDRALDLPAQTMEATGIGDALSRVADDVDVAARAVNNLVPNLIQLGFLVVITLVGMATLSPWLLLMVVVIVPMYAVAATWYLRRTAPIYRRERIAMGARAQGLLSAIHGIPTVHAYGIERRETRHVAVLSETAAVLNMKVMYLVSRLVMVLNVPENLALAMVLLFGFVMVQAGGAPVGLVTAAAVYLVTLFWPMMAVIFNLDEVQSALASLSRMVGVITSIDPASSPGHERPEDASIRLEQVSHAYGEDEHGEERIVLRPLDLDIAPGEVVSLVGASGAGKSTLAAILAGTLVPRHGRVLHGGADLARAELEAVRTHASIVSQDVHVFRGTLREDLQLAAPRADDEQLRRALRRVDALAWVDRLPKGLDTEVGEKGERLTAEQSQQLALARIALQDPAVLILDEATADEGSSGARVLERAALEVARGRTTIIVAHRLSQARVADRILVMADGAVVEQGSHEQLVAAGGAYSRLWEAWSS